MYSGIVNLLYRRPDLYEQVYHDDHLRAVEFCDAMFAAHLPARPATLLDLGSGTGCEVGMFAAAGIDAVGVDFQPSMVALARQSVGPAARFHVGDQRSVRLGRRFDAVISLGFTIANVHTNADIDRTFATYAAHTEIGGILILETLNLTDQAGANLPAEFQVSVDGHVSRGTAEFTMNHRTQLLTRRRTWRFPDLPDETDHAVFRVLFPKELEMYLTRHGFHPLSLYDNPNATPGPLTGSTLFTTARYEGPRKTPT
ncbi:class I SAM-dependent methyltransferase [Actinocorallia sp. A-T 12471]|uniref:class I SAM-dependent methyltransferase n=1 Tax=Actinocorallia sp. A-T 12471 TaxID=3089813 RepID=UPI0029CB3415|nr:class I SAM-dependent methyltransferase [Actinocorallia sp. A-T 12471]MDX6740439.1 class I SAM-dependent methyltransferase [Actinocorallia sp. A-T 12471]